ncbi:RNA polymerase sigma factor [Balneicella halophila]|uniref:RNA polymerase sigma factor n=1 Tax=Balneicella halophila TaxID=1537566 RepID=UPI0021D2A32F|nr:sigma-70 family RNA polymerase sigma factor [Balneicella halophila]
MYNKYASTMFAVCMRYCHSRQDAQDAFQDGFIKVFQHIQSHKRSESIEGWIRRIMVNTCIDKHRKENWIVTDTVEHQYNAQTLNHVTKEDSPVTLPTNEKLIELIQQLPKQYRTVFNMYVLEEYTHQEIANQLQISVSTSKSNLYRARKWLQNAIADENILNNK